MDQALRTLTEIAFIVFAIGLPALLILGRPFIRRWLDIREKQVALGAETAAEKSAQYVAHGERLEQRVRVVERIVTDRGIDLATQIEDLRDPAVN